VRDGLEERGGDDLLPGRTRVHVVHEQARVVAGGLERLLEGGQRHALGRAVARVWGVGGGVESFRWGGENWGKFSFQGGVVARTGRRPAAFTAPTMSRMLATVKQVVASCSGCLHSERFQSLAP